MHCKATCTLNSRVLVYGTLFVVGLVALYLYINPIPVTAPTTSTVVTSIVEQEATTTPLDDTAVEADAALMALDMKPWKWLSATAPDGTVVTPIKTEVFSIRFNASGAFTVETDCNSISGSYEARNGSLSLGSIASTKMFCEGSQEAEFTELLRNILTYRFTNNGQLNMTTNDGVEVVFR